MVELLELAEEEEVLSVELVVLEVTELQRRMTPLPVVAVEEVCAEECEVDEEVAALSEVIPLTKVVTRGDLQFARMLQQWLAAMRVKPKCLTKLASKILRRESRWACKDPADKK